MNDLDILASYINNKVRTTYVGKAPNFSIIKDILNKNCCEYVNEEHTITSKIYEQVGNSWMFDFGKVFLDNNEVPSDSSKQEKYCSVLSSMSIPIVYLDTKDGISY